MLRSSVFWRHRFKYPTRPGSGTSLDKLSTTQRPAGPDEDDLHPIVVLRRRHRLAGPENNLRTSDAVGSSVHHRTIRERGTGSAAPDFSIERKRIGTMAAVEALRNPGTQVVQPSAPMPKKKTVRVHVRSPSRGHFGTQMLARPRYRKATINTIREDRSAFPYPQEFGTRQ